MRIIAGEFRGRRLVAPKGMNTRPTTDRVREAWFSMLNPIEGSVVDIYAGTGALGFEALSRGASRVVFVENWRPAIAAIEQNAETLGVRERVAIITSAAEAASDAIRRNGPFDLVMTDPPWTQLERSARTLRRLISRGLFSDEGRLVLGHPRGKPIALDRRCGLTETKSRHWGDSAATFYAVAATEAPV